MAPARAALLTGRYPHRTGATGLRDLRGMCNLARRETTIADLLAASDYATGLVGKWYNRSMGDVHSPNSRGFGEFVGFRSGWQDYYEWVLNRNGTYERSDGRYLTDVFTDEAVEFIHRHGSHPFFLHLTYNAPHFPMQAPAVTIRYSGLQAPRLTMTGGMCRLMLVKLKYNSPVILTFTLISTLVLVIDTITGGTVAKTYFTVYPGFDFGSILSYVQLVSHVAGHANWMHLMANFSFILLIGPILEEKHGSQRMLVLILITALLTGIINAAFFSTGLMGASGIVFMLILLSSFTNIRAGEIPITFILIVALFLTKEIIGALGVEDEVSQFAHIIGGVCGGAFGFLITRRSS